MPTNEIKGEMIRGHIDTIILLSLIDGDKDSNEIRVAIEEKSENKYSVKQGTFYSAMQRLAKQNYIKEYRSSSVDGIRRKYFSLTTKGRSFLEKNREEWNKSKELIDNLIETPSEPQKKEEIKAQPIDEFDQFKRFALNNATDFDFIAPQSSDAYIDKLGEEALKDLNAELEALNADNNDGNDEILTVEDSSVPESPILSEDDEPIDEEFLIDATDEAPSKIEADDFENSIEEPQEEPFSEDDFSYDFELPEEQIEVLQNAEPTDNDDSPVDSDETQSQHRDEVENVAAAAANGRSAEVKNIEKSSNATEIFKEVTTETISINNTVESVEDKKELTSTFDDMLLVDEGKPTNSREYKAILGRLFPKEESEKNKVFAKQIDFGEASNDVKENEFFSDADDENQAEFDEKIEFDQKDANEESLRRETLEFKTNQSGDYDFSDLYAMAKKEGFKVRTSLSTNASNDGNIFVNKLNFHAATIHYLILFVEMAVLNLSLSSILSWSVLTKVVIAISLAAYLLVSAIMFSISPDRKVREISPFKDAVEVSLIIAFQLAIICLCVALFCEVDFENVKEVLSFIVLPFILFLNIPLFPIVKYALLSGGKYFDE